jgi:hypothetical protein
MQKLQPSAMLGMILSGVERVQKMKILGVGRYGIEDAEYDTARRVFDGQWYRWRPIRKPRLEWQPVRAVSLLQQWQMVFELQLA